MHEGVDPSGRYSIRDERQEEEQKNVDIITRKKQVEAGGRTWLRVKDPRIVRVSSSAGSGNKDRHSKVCTIRGLRDRRVRLSVPTAIQLYDLQSRLGLNQPSKVVDWLLNAAKSDIDQLPPLPFFPYPTTTTSTQYSTTSTFITNHYPQPPHHDFWNSKFEQDQDPSPFNYQAASFHQHHQSRPIYDDLQPAGSINNDETGGFHLGASGGATLRFQPINHHHHTDTNARPPLVTLPSVLMSLSSSQQQQQQQLGVLGGCNIRMDHDDEEDQEKEEGGSSSHEQQQFANTNFHTLLRLHSTTSVVAPPSSSSSIL